MVTAVATAQVPKFTVIIGGSFGAGNYGMCGRAYSPALPVDVAQRAHHRDGRRAGGHRAGHGAARRHRGQGRPAGRPRRRPPSSSRSASSTSSRATPTTPRARLWDDGIIDPAQTRRVLGLALSAALNAPIPPTQLRHVPDVRRRMFNKILIANRGEIACRVISDRAAHGHRAPWRSIPTPTPTRATCALADEAVLIGPPAARAVLPAWRADPRRRPGHRRAGDPPGLRLPVGERRVRRGLRRRPASSSSARRPSAIRAMGSKSAAKALMAKAGVPLTPGYHGDNQDPAFLAAQATRHRLPGADQGQRRRRRQGHARASTRREDFAAALASCQREAQARLRRRRMCWSRSTCCGRGTSRSRCSATRHGNCVYLFERDCSVQRRHQKVLEEAPAPGMTPRAPRGDGRRRRSRRPRRSATSAPARWSSSPHQDGSFYFMEMNTRLQVEHPVTEMITGLDLVEWQLRVAAGEPLPLRAGPAGRSTATRSRRASTPRTRTRASCRRPAGCCTCRRRRSASMCASTPASSRATRSRRTTTR